LVLAPHPDDETLGAGALLCTLADAEQPASVVYLTDGAASHAGSTSWPAGRLANLRRREARLAVRRLCGPSAPDPSFLGWADARPHPPGSKAFAATVARLVAMIRRDRIANIVTTWVHEPHCDHAAAAAVATEAARQMRGAVRRHWYVVWGWDESEVSALREAPAIALANPAAHRARRRAALASHRSQVTAMISDDPKAFRLPSAMGRAVVRPQVLFEASR
jgi:LmbE family N-acetylglucosaminyl deacetylase